MSTIPQPRFYVYVLARPDGRPFYVGKGQGDRVYQHDGEARRGHKCYKCNVIRKIWRQGQKYQRYIVFTTDNEQEALDYEKELIALHGRENLTNRTEGGAGVPAPDVRARAQQSRKIAEKWRDPEWRARVMANRHGEECRKRVAAKLKARWQTKEYREKVMAARSNSGMRAQAIEKRRARMKELWQIPEYRDKMMESRRKVASANMKAKWADPEWRAKQTERNRQNGLATRARYAAKKQKE